jgi:hypothetical protein
MLVGDALNSANPVDLCAQSDPIGAPEPMKIEPVLGAQIGGSGASEHGYCVTERGRPGFHASGDRLAPCERGSQRVGPSTPAAPVPDRRDRVTRRPGQDALTGSAGDRALMRRAAG